MHDRQHNAGFLAQLTATVFAGAMLGPVAGIVGGVASGTMGSVTQSVVERQEGDAAAGEGRTTGDVAYAREMRGKGKAAGVREVDDGEPSMNRIGS